MTAIFFFFPEELQQREQQHTNFILVVPFLYTINDLVKQTWNTLKFQMKMYVDKF